MIMRDRCWELEIKHEGLDEYLGEQITYKPTELFFANIRLLFSDNEDGVTNRQGLHHLEGYCVTKHRTDSKYILYDGHIFQIRFENPHTKFHAYKIREVRYKDGQLHD